ncbi:MAG: hypothetical protein HN948_01700 [Clostridia bacterium]|jgi:uroporphyrinogen-III decarboxylase|nr:hypothetical protein [Clostridia bacterium]MBT7121704.1 hypothetical protein [Clostridia bacterium]
MTERERILSVLSGGTPDRIPYMLDLSHFYNEKVGRSFHLLEGLRKADNELIAYHKKMGAGFYMPNQGVFYETRYEGDVKSTAKTQVVDGVDEITWEYETPFGEISRTRRWEPTSYSWPVKHTGVRTENDLKALGAAMGARKFVPRVDNYLDWKREVGEMGVVYLGAGYSAIGYLMNYWMGVENTLFASVDMNTVMHEVVEQINESNLKLVEMLAGEYPCEVIMLNDEFDSKVQHPAFFDEWSSDYYTKAIDIAHKHGKKVSVIYNGNMRGTLGGVCACGADAISAVTPYPMGDLTPEQCRNEAGERVVLSGGVSPDLWLPEVPIEQFEKACMEWIAMGKQNSAIIADASNQVPPRADESRIEVYRELLEKHGRY